MFSEPKHEKGEGASPRRPTLVRRVLIGVNLTLIGVLGIFAAWDYRIQSRMYVQQIKIALDEEARVLLRSVERVQAQGEPAVQEFVNEVCGIMKEPQARGHHMALRMEDATFIACPHHRASLPAFAALEAAANSVAGIGEVEDHVLVVGKAQRPEMLVYVADYVAAITAILRSAVLRRISSILAAGLALGIVLNVVLHRVLLRPVQDMLPVVQRFGAGRFDERMPQVKTMELGLLADEFDHMAGMLEESERERHLRMNTARRIQERLLPDLSAPKGVQCQSRFEPADEVAGDFYDVLPLPDGALLLCVADVSGHGVPGAMVASMLKALLRSAAEHENEPAELLRMVNAALCRLSPDETFATMALARLDATRQGLSMASAGHEPAFLLPSEHETERLPATGPVLGIDEAARWATIDRTVSSADRLIMVTDGLAETASPTGEMFGKERLQAVLEDGRAEKLQALLDRIAERLATHRADGSPKDDITVLAVEF
jgi:serine phosphatase RsbU (regulator of sigma subunit)